MPADAPMRCCEMADVLLQIKPRLQLDLSKQGLSPLMEDIELPFITVLADMEIAGVRIDVGELAKMSVSLTQRLVAMEQEAYELAGSEFNVASPMQVGDILFGRLQIDPKAKRTKTGAYSTTEEILEKYRHTHPLVDLILKIRGLRKLLSTYVNALPELINPATNRIHTSYNQTVTATGRLSSSNPNLQNIPVRSDDGKEIRRAFIADEGDIFLAADYSQIELRLIADMSGDREMIDAFLSGADIHQATAAKIYKVPIDQVTANQRRNAKTANFGIIYGISAFGLSQRLRIPRSEAKQLIEGYFESYPKVKEYMDNVVAAAREKGYVETLFGRRRYLADIDSRNANARALAERNAINAPIQGTAADIMKMAMVGVARRFKEEGVRSRITMQVHDEIVVDLLRSEREKVEQIVREEMEGAAKLSIPLTAECGVGANWLEAH
jgi:DNA polymerase-1